MCRDLLALAGSRLRRGYGAPGYGTTVQRHYLVTQGLQDTRTQVNCQLLLPTATFFTPGATSLVIKVLLLHFKAAFHLGEGIILRVEEVKDLAAGGALEVTMIRHVSIKAHFAVLNQDFLCQSILIELLQRLVDRGPRERWIVRRE